MGFGMSNTLPWVVIAESIKDKCYGLCDTLQAVVQLWLSFHFVLSGNPATLSGVEPSVGAQDSKEDPGPQMGLVLGGGLPSIPADLLQRIRKKQYVELTEFLPERIQESFLFPDGKKRKLQPIDKFLDWVLAFCTFSQALAASSPHLAADLLTFVGTVARLARDHPGSAWASYEQAARAKAVANPEFHWNKLDQELWALATVKGFHGHTHDPTPHPASFKAKRSRVEACFKWNEGNCTFRACKYSHVCSHCLSHQHKVGSCPTAPTKVKKTN
jgi:hypothetical protein